MEFNQFQQLNYFNQFRFFLTLERSEIETTMRSGEEIVASNNCDEYIDSRNSKFSIFEKNEIF